VLYSTTDATAPFSCVIAIQVLWKEPSGTFCHHQALFAGFSFLVVMTFSYLEIYELTIQDIERRHRQDVGGCVTDSMEKMW